jgi:putative addiction module component (TIGR02574 family)
MTLSTLQKEAAALPETERAQLIDFLWQLLASADLQQRERAWAAESERRITALDEGHLTTRDAREVIDELRKKVSR